MQGTLRREWVGDEHQIVAGAAFDAGTTDFDQSAQPATFVDDREAVGIGAVRAGDGGDDDEPLCGRLCGRHDRADARMERWSLSGRYNWARDHDAGPTAAKRPRINGTSTYRRFNPAAGATWTSEPRHSTSSAA